MKKTKVAARFWCMLFMSTLLMGCGMGAVGDNTEETQVSGLETVPVLDYTVPSVLPGVLLNQIGYQPASRKVAVVQGSSLPATFKIIEAVSGEVMYQGKLEAQGYDETKQEYISYGDFSDFQTEGVYYLECDVVGRSYTFSVEDGLYEALLQESLDVMATALESAEKTDTVEICRGMSALLLSYELYGTVYDNEVLEGNVPPIITQMKAYADWLLSLQDVESGAVMDGDTPLIVETGWLCATLTKFSYTYQKYDSVYATVCLQAADRAWKYLDKADAAKVDHNEVLFYAATELFRATGQYSYHNGVKNLGKNLLTSTDNEAFVYGTLTYAATKRRVDVDLCGTWLKTVLDEAEGIAEKAKASNYMIGSSAQKDGLDAVLWDTVILSAIDYVITNNEYATLLENYHNYLGGENEQTYCYLYSSRRESPAEETIADNCVRTAQYVLMLSEILSHEADF